MVRIETGAKPVTGSKGGGLRVSGPVIPEVGLWKMSV
jgi:hypothetical protein